MKTLKDIVSVEDGNVIFESVLCDVDKLRDVAREWVKYYQKKMHPKLSYVFHGTDDSPEYREARGAMSAFMKFFNLEEDE